MIIIENIIKTMTLSNIFMQIIMMIIIMMIISEFIILHNLI